MSFEIIIVGVVLVGILSSLKYISDKCKQNNMLIEYNINEQNNNQQNNIENNSDTEVPPKYEEIYN